ncbi:MAG: DNA-3-methyladenine glycosylase 2 family protein [Parvularculaceae bacterium]|nr:DNA-3-methyladenine glycosylase 2 family protein [Parvularculaceae bacterium]
MEQSCAQLAERCPVIADILSRTGPPSWRARPAGYPGLARIVIEQQLSVASANAILKRARGATGGLRPARVALATEDDLRSLGLSRPKIRYLKALADDVLSRRFRFSTLAGLSDQEAADELTKLLGIGPWTAAVYLLFCEGRQDLWPRADVALLAAHQMAGGSFERSELAAFDDWADATYAPYRGMAAHILWGQIAYARGRAPL